MKKLLNTRQPAKFLATVSLVAATFALGAGQAQAALLINGTDVGQLDTVIGAVDSTNSGLQTEETLLEQFACGGTCNLTLVDNVDITNNQLVSDGGLNYIDVSPNEPGYYVLKFGTGNTGNDMFFLKNEVFLQFLAWSDAELIAAGLPSNHVNSISHYAITEGGGVVPEPGALSLLGIALVGAVTARTRKK